MSFVLIFKRPFVTLILSALMLLAAGPAVAGAAEAPAGVQYEYSPIPSAGDSAETASPTTNNGDSGTPDRFPILLIAAIVLVLAAFIGKVTYDRRKSGAAGGSLPMPTIPLFLAGAILIAVLGLGASGTTAAPTPKAPKGFLGIDPQEGIGSVDTKRMEAGGVASIRIPVSWSTVEPTRDGGFDFGLYDEAFHAAAEQGMTILPTLYSTPKWVAGKTTTLPTSSAQLADWKAFVAAAVDRFGSNGTFWDEPEQADVKKSPPKSYQLWNEANYKYFAYPVSPKNYAKLVKAGSSAIRSEDPKADVMLSGLFGRPKGSAKQALFASDFIKGLGKYLPKSQFDSLAIHPYSFTTADLESIMKEFRKAADKAGYRSKPINVTEIGWGSGKKTNKFLLGSESAQAKQLTSALGYLVSARHKFKLKSAYWYAWQDTDPKGVNCNFCYTVGLFKYNKNPDVLKPKKAWTAFTKLTGGES